MNQFTQARVFLVDDHPVLEVGLASILEPEPDLELVGYARSANVALKKIAEEQPDLIILDIALRESDGLDLLGQLRTQFRDTPVLVYSFHDEVYYAERALRAGAMGYVMKAKDAELLIEAIRKLLSGQIYVSSRIKAKMLSEFSAGYSLDRKSPIASLSNRELQVVQFIGEGHDNAQIAERTGLSIKTVETHRSRIKKKLGLDNSIELIRFAVRWVENEFNTDISENLKIG